MVLSVLALILFYYLFEYMGVPYPLKESIFSSIALIGSFGTIASIYYAIHIHQLERAKALELEKNLIRANKPQLLIEITDCNSGVDTRGQEALILDLRVFNHSHSASSFSLNWDKLPNVDSNLVVEFDYPAEYSIINKGEHLNIDACITNSDLSLPAVDEINFYIKAVYIDKGNNFIEDYFMVKKNAHGSLSCNGPKKSSILTAGRVLLEL